MDLSSRQALPQASVQMQDIAERIGGVAGDAEGKLSLISAYAEQSFMSVDEAATAADQLSGAVRQIAGETARAAGGAQQAALDVRRSAQVMEDLQDAAQKIGDVASLIREIARQTNLLALNATIEAARVGDAGRGFAVVALEVKALSWRTAEATKSVATQVAAMRQSVSQATECITGVGRTVADFEQIATGIAAAVEQQSAATESLAGSLKEAAAGTREIYTGLDGFAGAITAMIEIEADVRTLAATDREAS
ncbi:methyl-accepting chemotaxis protein [Skermanella aerolata]|uniref:methyl-accepting chemotaxis protein n=1 Tax=Skermanella aerolata TaxID=393310 RepID=UPI003D1F35C0